MFFRRPALALLLTVLSPALAVGQETTVASSETAVERARAAVRADDHERAIEILESARAHSEDPQLDYELYVVNEAVGRLLRAADALESYLDATEGFDVEQRPMLERHLRELRGESVPPEASLVRPIDDPILTWAGWTQLGIGIAGGIVFLASAAIAGVLEGNRDDACKADERACMANESGAIRDAWNVAWAGAGTGAVFLILGATYLALAGQVQGGATRALPVDLDPSMQRGFTLLPTVGGEHAGLRAVGRF